MKKTTLLLFSGKFNLGSLILKTLLLFILFNLLYAVIDPPLDQYILLDRRSSPGSERFPQLWIPEETTDGTIFLGRQFISNMPFLFGSHEVSSPARRPGEYRIFIFGDSSVWGTLLSNAETLSGQINALKLEACGGRPVVAYNLGYPSNSATKDLILMEAAQKYEPDLSIWLFSLLAFTELRQHVPFVIDNPQAVSMLVEKYGLAHQVSSPSRPSSSLLDRTIIGRRQDLHLLVQLYLSTYITNSIGTDDPRILADIVPFEKKPSASFTYMGIDPPADLRDYLALDTLEIANKINNGKIIYVNEPIFIASGAHSEISYNDGYPRWAYDQYRSILEQDSAQHGWKFLDTWNLVDPERYTNGIFHMDPAGERILAERISQAIMEQVCP